MQKAVVVQQSQGCDVYIGRSRTAMHFGNPFTHKQGTLASVLVATREEAVRYFKEWLDGRQEWARVEPERRQWILDHLHTLKGKRLGCFCVPLDCHGDVLARIVNEVESAVR